MPHKSHSLLAQLNKNIIFLQVCPREIENLVSEGLIRVGGWKIFHKNKLGALIQDLGVLIYINKVKVVYVLILFRIEMGGEIFKHLQSRPLYHSVPESNSSM